MADPADSGIYEIVNLVNGKRYIGSAVCLRRRWRGHVRDLNRSTHHNKALQRAWDKYGEQGFSFRVIEVCHKGNLIAREQAALDALQPEYNICKTAGSTAGAPTSAELRAQRSARMMGNQNTKGVKFSPEICARMGAGKIGKKYKPRSKEHCQSISAAKKGNKSCLGRVLSDETKEKIRAANIGKKQPMSLRLRKCTLSDGQVREIQSMLRDGIAKADIHRKTGVSETLVRHILRGDRYEWVDPSFLLERPKGNVNYSDGARRGWASRRSSGT